MKSFFISQTAMYSLGYTILHSLWQGLAVALFVGLLLFLLKKQPSKTRYWLSLGALGLQLIMSIFTFVYEHRYWSKIFSFKSNTSQILNTNLSEFTRFSNIQVPWYKLLLIQIQLHLDMVVLFWLIGTSVLLFRLILGWISTNQLKNNGLQKIGSSVEIVFNRLLQRVNISQKVSIYESVKIFTPIVIGFLKPIILLPVGLASGLSTKQLEAILVHELAHIKRYDYVINILQSVVEALYFFHPALWWLSSKIRIERENCCDDMAVLICEDKLALAQALTAIETYRQTPALVMAFLAHKNQLLNRIKRVLGVSERQSFGMNNLVGISLIALLLMGFTVYAVQQEPKKKDKKSTKVVKSKSKITTSNELEDVLNSSVELASESMIDVEKLTETLSGAKDILANAKGVFTLDSSNDSLLNSFTKKMAFHQRKVDSLQRLMEPNNDKVRELQLQMEKYQFSVEEVERQDEVLEWKKSKIQDDRSKLMEKRNQLLHPQNEKEPKKNEADIEKQITDLEQQIKGKETQIQQINDQAIALKSQIIEAKKPVKKLQKEIDEFEAVNSKLSDQMFKFTQEQMGMMEPRKGDTIRVNDNWRRIGVAPPRPPRMRAPRMPKLPRMAMPPVPPVRVR